MSKFVAVANLFYLSEINVIYLFKETPIFLTIWYACKLGNIGSYGGDWDYPSTF